MITYVMKTRNAGIKEDVEDAEESVPTVESAFVVDADGRMVENALALMAANSNIVA